MVGLFKINYTFFYFSRRFPYSYLVTTSSRLSIKLLKSVKKSLNLINSHNVTGGMYKAL